MKRRAREKEKKKTPQGEEGHEKRERKTRERKKERGKKEEDLRRCKDDDCRDALEIGLRWQHTGVTCASVDASVLGV